MDDSAVQTAICVIGHPIAGNPSQFCTLRALAAMGLEWQCLSFDVPPQSLPAAIAGIDVLRFAGALIGSPHHLAAAALLAPPAVDPALPSPSPNASCHWIDGLQRGENDELIGCNFLGEAFAQLLQAHQQKIGQPLRHCVYLGDAASFQALMVPYLQYLPSQCMVLSDGGLQAWPPVIDPPHADTRHAEPRSASDSSTGGGGNGDGGGGDGGGDGAGAARSAGPAADTSAAPEAEPPLPPSAAAEPQAPEPDPTPDPLTQPLLLIRLQRDPREGKKLAKLSPLQQSVIESLLEQIHPDSLRMDLAPPGAAWPVLRGSSDRASQTVTPLDLEIGRVAAAIKRWTGREADRDLLAESIEEYLEI